jgi:predicted AAA+ superfamily ATPase
MKAWRYHTLHLVGFFDNYDSVSTERPFWQSRLELAWKQAPIAWLAGVRRSGKTTLARSLGDGRALYVNCDLPAAVESLRDPALFFRHCDRPIVVLDEIHQLPDPSRVLKIAADEFPDLRVLATGSSTLAASHKFRDTLTGRKRLVHLVPVLTTELAAFGVTLPRRLYHGGLPPALLAEAKEPSFYREWLDSFFARDIQRLFAFRDINKFNALLEYMLRQSGGQLEVSRTSSALGVSRPTVESHLQALEITRALTLVRPFSGGGQAEIIRQPKAYAFDTGFVSFARGWDPLRSEDRGVLWEHLALEAMQARWPDEPSYYWRDKAGREVDFVRPRGRDTVDAYECKWDPSALEADALKVFREHYPKGKNYLLTPLSGPAYPRRVKGLEFTVCGLDALS